EYQQIDDTSTRVNGCNCYTQIVSNPYYTAFFTDTHKNRLSVIDILQGCGVRTYYFTEEAFVLLIKFGLSLKMINRLRELADGKKMNEDEMEDLLAKIFPDTSKGRNQRSRIKEAAAIAAYHWQTDFPVIEVLLSDDAPQYKHLTSEHGLCWVHEGRHFKKLSPVVPENIDVLKSFRKEFWQYYGKLLRYKADPTSEMAKVLESEFDELFATRTEYKALNDRIEKTEGKKVALLKVLQYPELPLHNNASELGARAQKRRQDVSLHTKTEEGAKAGDTFMTIVETAKKLGVKTKEYFEDRISGKFQMPSLADQIVKKTLNAKV
ncbi:MAG: transposase, partial [Cytophagales bacterium]|nr:transposase [Cytophagales bacterium]